VPGHFLTQRFLKIREEVDITGLFQTMLTGEQFHITCILKALKDLFGLFYAVKPVETFCAFPYLTGCLGSPEKQDAKYRGFLIDKIVSLEKTMGVFGDPAQITLPDQALAFKAVKGFHHGFFIVGNHRLPVGFLVASIHEGI
jgi:hypothetical protein